MLHLSVRGDPVMIFSEHFGGHLRVRVKANATAAAARTTPCALEPLQRCQHALESRSRFGERALMRLPRPSGGKWRERMTFGGETAGRGECSAFFEIGVCVCVGGGGCGDGYQQQERGAEASGGCSS